MGNIRVKALFSHPRSCEYPWREYDAEALLQRATVSHVVLFTELVPSPLTSPDSFHHYQAHNLTTTTIATASTILPLWPPPSSSPACRCAAATARCPQQRHRDHHRARRQNERWKWYRERRRAFKCGFHRIRRITMEFRAGKTCKPVIRGVPVG